MQKAEVIRKTLRETKERRKTQTAKTYELKLDRSHLSEQTLHHLSRLFLEAKWLYNYILSREGFFAQDYRIEMVPVKVKDHLENREISHLSSQMKQGLIDRLKDNMRGMHKLRENGHRIGRLRFKSRFRSIPLKQYGVTYAIVNRHYVRMQRIKQRIRVEGLEQIPKDAELTSATLVQKHGDYYLHLTTYQPKPSTPQIAGHVQPKSVGIDLGLAKPLTLSNGVAIRYEVPATRRLRRLCRRMSRRKRFGNNWWKMVARIDKEYDYMNGVKADITNKVASKIAQMYDVVGYQHDNLSGWQRIWGRRMLNTRLGGIIRVLERKARTPVEVNRFYPSTKLCFCCGHVNPALGLDERIVVCKNCGHAADRDYNASKNNEAEALRRMGVPMVRREFTPVDTEATTSIVEYFKNIPYVEASLVVETGSLAASARGGSRILGLRIPELQFHFTNA